ncbi:hypothetical protein FACS1894176_07240 [Bacteroidia bacterium]|nr:hypothetical protein FACS1894176_07240 [Bacteroidia bacterium]
MKNATEADENKKVCDIYYNTTDKSKEFANDLFNNGFGYYYNGKKAESVSHGAIPSEGNHYYYVVRESNVKGACVLVEIANISNPDQAYLMRNPETRQTLAKQFVDALIKTVQ